MVVVVNGDCVVDSNSGGDGSCAGWEGKILLLMMITVMTVMIMMVIVTAVMIRMTVTVVV